MIKRPSISAEQPDEWKRRFDELMARRRKRSAALGLEEGAVDRKVLAAVREVRDARR